MNELIYDKTIRINDIVTSYDDGYWEVTHIEIRKPYKNGVFKNITPPPLLSGNYVMTSSGIIVKHGKTNTWDASHSQKVTKEWIMSVYNKEIDNAAIKRDNLFHLIGNNYDY